MKKQNFAAHIAAMREYIKTDDYLSAYADALRETYAREILDTAEHIFLMHGFGYDMKKERAKILLQMWENDEIEFENFSGYWVGDTCFASVSGEEHEFQFSLSDYDIKPSDDLSEFDAYVNCNFESGEGLFYINETVGVKAMIPGYFFEWPTMRTKLPAKISTIEEAKKYIASLCQNNEVYHFDDDALEIIWDTSEPTEYEKRHLNRLRDQIYSLPGYWSPTNEGGFDACGYALELLDLNGQ